MREATRGKLELALGRQLCWGALPLCALPQPLGRQKRAALRAAAPAAARGARLRRCGARAHAARALGTGETKCAALLGKQGPTSSQRARTFLKVSGRGLRAPTLNAASDAREGKHLPSGASILGLATPRGFRGDAEMTSNCN